MQGLTSHFSLTHSRLPFAIIPDWALPGNTEMWSQAGTELYKLRCLAACPVWTQIGAMASWKEGLRASLEACFVVTPFLFLWRKEDINVMNPSLSISATSWYTWQRPENIIVIINIIIIIVVVVVVIEELLSKSRTEILCNILKGPLVTLKSISHCIYHEHVTHSCKIFSQDSKNTQSNILNKTVLGVKSDQEKASGIIIIYLIIITRLEGRKRAG